MNQKAVIGVVGLAVMGENLALNFANHGFQTAVYNRTTEKTDAFLAGRAAGKPITGCRTLAEFVATLERPRRIILMVKAGQPVDDCIAGLLPLLDPGDVLMDGGNSFYQDTRRRCRELEQHEILYLGVGISGGEEGALNGPSIMPGGDEKAWPLVRPLLQAVAARVADGTPCCDWVGPDGAGHFVKMVHNGIEYADMMLISESYALMRNALRLSNAEIAEVFHRWNRGPLEGYLLEITGRIFRTTDPESGDLLLDRILDTPGQKGTGRWTSEAALALAVPAPTLAAAVSQRCLDADLELRRTGGKRRAAPKNEVPPADRNTAVAALEQALYASKICAYAQGFALLRATETAFGWQLNYGSIALLWRGGCIIRAVFLEKIKEAFDRDPALENLLFDPFFSRELAEGQTGWRRTAVLAAESGVAAPGTASALGYFDTLRTSRSAANLIQAQRDFFGAHTFERTDRPRGQFFHHNWNCETTDN